MTRRTALKRKRWPPSKAKLAALIEEAMVDACTESEQRVGFCTLLDERLDTPFDTEILGVTVTVERVDMTRDEQIVAISMVGGVLSALVPIRNELMTGDYRALYLAWQLRARAGEISARNRTPPVPIGTSRLTGSQQALVEFLRIDAP